MTFIEHLMDILENFINLIMFYHHVKLKIFMKLQILKYFF